VSSGNRVKARAEGLASPRAGAIANPASQASRWALLNRAIKIDRDAAYASTSWGLGQVMGEHWRWLGYASVDALVAEARAGFAGQLRLMLLYIEKAGLTDAVRRRDWSAFARAYNGPAYARHGYHTRLAAAYARRAGSPGEGSPSLRLLRLGMSGADVATLQRHLLAISPDQHDAIAVDGVFGPQTLAALKAFQLGAGLTPDGIAGPLTWAALERVAQLQPKHVAVQPWSWLIALLNRLNPLI